jgi:PTH2 family peptidyl-tRNA hydrolase
MKNEEIKQVIVVRKDLNMRKGKLAAQVAHASMKFLMENNESNRGDELFVRLSNDEADWINNSFTKVVVGVDSADELEFLIMKGKAHDLEVNEIIDSGKTEFAGVNTLTCAAFGPNKSSLINKVTGHLKLL